MQSDKESGLRPPYRNCHLTTGDKGSDAEHHLTVGDKESVTSTSACATFSQDTPGNVYSHRLSY